MIRFATFIIIALTAITAGSHVVYAAINPEINYQGKLTGVSNNQAVTDGDYHMEFKLYTVASGGSPIWTETRTSGDVVTVENGLFSVMLGEVTSLAGVDFNQTLYLGVNIGGSGGSPSWDGEMTPRKKIGAVPAAFNSDKLDGLTSSDFLSTTTYSAPSIGSIGSSSATTTAAGNFIVTGTTRLASSLSGIIKATAGYITTALVDLASDVTGILGISNGGTGISTAPSYGELLVGDGLGGYNLLATSSLGISGGSSQWSDSGSDIYFDTGNVGIGTDSISSRLTVLNDIGLADSGGTGSFNLIDDEGADIQALLGAKILAGNLFDDPTYIGVGGVSEVSSTTALSIGVLGTASGGATNLAGLFLGDVLITSLGGNGTTVVCTNDDGLLSSSGCSAGSGASDWSFDTNFGGPVLTPSTTIATWFKAPVYTSSSVTFHGGSAFATTTIGSASSSLTIAEYNLNGGVLEGKFPILYGSGEINLLGELAGLAVNAGSLIVEDASRNASPYLAFISADFGDTFNSATISYETSTPAFKFDHNIILNNTDVDPDIRFDSNSHSSNITLLDASDTLSFTNAFGGYSFDKAITVGGSATSTFNWNIEVSGDVVPSTDNTYSLGRLDRVWKDVYIGPGSLYINGQKVLEEDASNIVVSADTNQSLILKTLGSGDVELNPTGTGQIALKGNIEVTGGKVITTSDNSPLEVEDGILLGNIQITDNEISATNLNGGISLTPAGSGGVYVTSGNFGVGTTTPGSKLTVQENSADGTYALQLNNWGSSGDWLKMINRLGLSSVEFKQNAGGDSLLNMYDLSGNTNVVIHTNGDSYFNSGNFGIGTSTPQDKLVVSGGDFNVYASSTADVANFYSSFENIYSTNYDINRLTISAPTEGVSKDIYFRGSGSNTILTGGDLNIAASGGDIILGKGVSYVSKGVQDVATPYVKIADGGNVGIGTTTPDSIFHVYTPASVGRGMKMSSYNPYLTLNDLSGSATAYQAYVDGNLFQLTYGTNSYETEKLSNVALTVNSSGNVGIGTTNPFLGQLHVNAANSGGLGGDLWITNSGTNAVGSYTRIAFGSDNTTDSVANAGIENIITNTGSFLSDLAFKIYNGSSYAEHLRITSAGRVGIGTASPEGLLEVQGAEATNAAFYLDADDGDDAADTWIVQSEAATNYFSVTNNATSLLQLDSGGSLGIGTSNPAWSGLSGEHLTLQTNDGNPARIQIYNRSDSVSNGAYFGQIAFYAGTTAKRLGSIISIARNTSENTGDLIFTTMNAGTESNKMIITAAGNVGVGAATPGALLDIGTAGTTAGVMRLAGSTSGNVTVQVAAAAGTWTLTLPTTAGTNGQQLRTDGSGTTSWSAASSLRNTKDIVGQIDTSGILDQLLSTPVYRFHYKEGMGTGDTATEYVGIMADEAPWAMHYDGTILNPINTFGYALLGIQATNERIVDLENQFALLQGVSGSTSTPPLVIDGVALDQFDTITVQQSATFYGVITVIGEANFTSRVVFEEEVEFKNHITVDRDTAGSITLEEGDDEVKVEFERPYTKTPRIVATLQTLEDVRYAITDKTVDGFTISLLDDAPVDLIFDWIALASDDPEVEDLENQVSNSPDSGDTVISVDAPVGDGAELNSEVSNDPGSGVTVIDVETPLVPDSDESEENEVEESLDSDEVLESVDTPDVDSSESDVSTEEGV